MRKRERSIIEGDSELSKGLKIPSLGEKKREDHEKTPPEGYVGLFQKVRSMMSTKITKPLGSLFLVYPFLVSRG